MLDYNGRAVNLYAGRGRKSLLSLRPGMAEDMTTNGEHEQLVFSQDPQ